MKILLSLLIVASSISAQAQGSIHLTAGQSYTYSFSTVPYLGIGTDANYGFATWYFANGSSYAPGTQALLEMFETSVTDAPVRSRLTSFFFDSSLGGNGVGGSGLWQDVQGVMRLTVVSGAVDLSGMKVEVLGGPFDPFGHHVQLVSVPEPSSLLLFGLGMLALYSFSKWRGQGLSNNRLRHCFGGGGPHKKAVPPFFQKTCVGLLPAIQVEGQGCP